MKFLLLCFCYAFVCNCFFFCLWWLLHFCNLTITSFHIVFYNNNNNKVNILRSHVFAVLCISFICFP